MSPRARGALVVAGLLAAVLHGLALRWPLLDKAITSDELANVSERPLGDLLLGDESAVNPPLLRLALTAWAPEVAPYAGRWLSLVAGLAAVVVVGGAARRASGRDGAAPLAALLLAGCFQAIRVSAEARAYAPAMLVLAIWAWAAVAWAEGDRRATWAVVVAAAALPWLHYATIPMLLGTGIVAAMLPRLLPLVALHVPAALAALPLLPAVLGESGARVATPEPVGRSLALVASLGQRVPGASAGDAGLPAALTLALVGVAALGLRRLRGGEQVLLAASVAGLVAVPALAQVQYVRPPVGALVAVPLVALAASLTSRAPRPLALAGVVVLTTWFVGGTVAPWRSWAAHDPFAPLDVAAARWGEVTAGASVVEVAPPSAVAGLAWRLTGHTLPALSTAACPGTVPCFAHQGQVIRAGAGEGCEARVEEGALTLWACEHGRP